jgi:hypothetical protein
MGLLAFAGWFTALAVAVLQFRQSRELDRLRRYRNAAEGRGYYTKAELDEAWERLSRLDFAPPKGAQNTSGALND